MADIVVTPANVGMAFTNGRIRSFLAGAAINGGQAVYIDASGLAQLTNAATSAATATLAGVALPGKNSAFAAGAGQPVEVLQEGELEGFTIAGLAFGTQVYLSAVTPGGLATTAGAHGQGPIGVVVPTTEKDTSGNLRKLIRLRDPVNGTQA